MSVRRNFIYNLILTFSSYLFPLLTYPYVSRVLGVIGIGTCNFVDSIIDYFILFSGLGIGSYGVREIARYKDNKKKCDEIFSNLFLIHFTMTILLVVVLCICTFVIPYFTSYKDFICIGVVKLIFNLFLIEWFYQGIQHFKYITIRSIIVRSIYVISVFLFVKDNDDVLVYYALTTLTIVLNAFFNWNYSRKFVKFNFVYMNLKLYIMPVLTFGYYRILTSMYTTFNTIFLGFTLGNAEVGYFSTATKLYYIILSVFTAFTTVMVPHISLLLQKKDYQEMQLILNKTIMTLLILAIPIIIVCELLAPWIINIIAGNGYEGAILPFRIVIFLLLIIGMEQVVIQQFLMASNTNKVILKVSTLGAIVGISLNFVFTPRLGAVGSSIAWGCSELAVLIVGVMFMKKYMGLTVLENAFSRKK